MFFYSFMIPICCFNFIRKQSCIENGKFCPVYNFLNRSNLDLFMSDYLKLLRLNTVIYIEVIYIYIP